ncbi:Uncharacterized protein Adt_45134 [Abeliophyllum distichum]|uniref:Uncharacterized protein n=1 Tax=Abeliophyllum distichum TaxID=126358 RepID=A0ABD1PDL9_9LAMI
MSIFNLLGCSNFGFWLGNSAKFYQPSQVVLETLIHQTGRNEEQSNEEHLQKVDKEMENLNLTVRVVTSKVDSCDLTLKVLCNRQEKMENIMSDMNQNYETLVAMMAQISGDRNEANKQAGSSAP